MRRFPNRSNDYLTSITVPSGIFVFSVMSSDTANVLRRASSVMLDDSSVLAAVLASATQAAASNAARIKTFFIFFILSALTMKVFFHVVIARVYPPEATQFHQLYLLGCFVLLRSPRNDDTLDPHGVMSSSAGATMRKPTV